MKNDKLDNISAKAHQTLSIIIPTLNEEKTLPQTLHNIAVCAPECEVIVVDGGSTDGTRACFETFTEIPILWVDAPCGRGRQMNAGAERATGDVLLFLHADTHLPPETPSLIRIALHANPEAPGGYFRIAFQPQTPLTSLYAACYNLRSRWWGICYGDAALFLRREAFDALNGYQAARIMEDYDLVMRARRRGRLAFVSHRSVVSSSRRFPDLWTGLKMLGVWLMMHLFWTFRIDQETMQRFYPARR